MRSASRTPNRKRALVMASVLATLVICTLMAAVLINLAATRRAEGTGYEAMQKARLSAESGIAYADAFISGIRTIREAESLNGHRETMNGEQRFELQAVYRQGYLWVRSRGFYGEISYTVEAYLGHRLPVPAEAALVVASVPFDEMFVSGSTKIQGDLILPKVKLEPKALHRLPAASDRFLEGYLERYPINGVPLGKPFLIESARRDLKDAQTLLFGAESFPEDEVWNLAGQEHNFKGDITLPETLKRIQGPGKIKINGSLTLNGQIEILGHAELIVSGDITISEARAKINAAFIAGNNFSARGSFEGTATILARQNLSLLAGCKLSAGSVAGLIQVPEMTTTGLPVLLINGAQFDGVLFSWDERAWTAPIIRIESGSRCSGYVLGSGKVDLRAPFRGHVRCHELVAMEGAQMFTNWMKNLEINRDPEQINWALPLGFGETGTTLTWVKR